MGKLSEFSASKPNLVQKPVIIKLQESLTILQDIDHRRQVMYHTSTFKSSIHIILLKVMTVVLGQLLMQWTKVTIVLINFDLPASLL